MIDVEVNVEDDADDDPALVIRVLAVAVTVVVAATVGVVVAPGDEEEGVGNEEEEDAVDSEDTGPVEDVDKDVRGGLLDRSRKEAKVLTLNRLLRLDLVLRGATPVSVVELVVAVSDWLVEDDEDEGGVLSAVEKSWDEFSSVGEEDEEGGEVEGEERVDEEEELRDDLR